MRQLDVQIVLVGALWQHIVVQRGALLTLQQQSTQIGALSGMLQRWGLTRDSPDTVWSWVGEEDGKIFAWFRLRWLEGRCRMSFSLGGSISKDASPWRT